MVIDWFLKYCANSDNKKLICDCCTLDWCREECTYDGDYDYAKNVLLLWKKCKRS